nr:probable cytochrome P450 4aa1 [Plodia interpunctella]
MSPFVYCYNADPLTPRRDALLGSRLQNIFGDSSRQPNKEDLMKMEYLERVIKETMRLFTVVPLIARRTQKEVKLSSLSVPAGVGCAVVPRALHRLARLWGADAGFNPDRFNPDRFRPEYSARKHPYAFIFLYEYIQYLR